MNVNNITLEAKLFQIHIFGAFHLHYKMGNCVFSFCNTIHTQINKMLIGTNNRCVLIEACSKQKLFSLDISAMSTNHMKTTKLLILISFLPKTDAFNEGIH